MLGKMLAGKFFRVTVSENHMKSHFLFGFFDFVNVSLCHYGLSVWPKKMLAAKIVEITLFTQPEKKILIQE